MPHRVPLDGLRFLAFLAVFVYHVDETACPWGWAGVNLFFALSGFLITRILMVGESGHLGADLGRFYLRRTLRIFPLYYAIVILVGPMGPRGDLPWLLTYTSNIKAYLSISHNFRLGHFWSLCVEEQFYLLYPPLLMLCPRRYRALLVVALIAESKAFQYHALTTLPMPWPRLLLPYCGEDLLWGCLAGMIDLKARRGRWEGTASFLVGLAVLVLAWNMHESRLPIVYGVQQITGLTMMAIGCALVVFGAWRTTNPWINRFLSMAPMAYLGRISYGLYAFHLPILHSDWFASITGGIFAVRLAGGLAATTGLAALSWRFYERPINRLKDRLAPPRRAVTGDQPATGSETFGEATPVIAAESPSSVVNGGS